MNRHKPDINRTDETVRAVLSPASLTSLQTRPTLMKSQPRLASTSLVSLSLSLSLPLLSLSQSLFLSYSLAFSLSLSRSS